MFSMSFLTLVGSELDSTRKFMLISYHNLAICLEDLIREGPILER